MVHDHRGKDFTHFEDGFIKRKVSQMIGQAGLNNSDRLDLQQDLYIHSWNRLRKFKPEDGNRNAFATKVVENYVCTVLRNRRAAKRNPSRVCSLNVPVGSTDDRRTELSDTVADDAMDARLGRHVRRPVERRQLADDVAQTISKLPADLQELAEKLKVGNVSQVAENLGVPRTTLYSALASLRTHCDQAGLRDYL